MGELPSIRHEPLQTGQLVLADTAAALLKNPLVREAYLGELT